MADETINRCDGCTHWDTSWGGEQSTAAPTYYDRETKSRAHLPGVWGDCQRIKHLSGDSHGRPPWLDEPTEDAAYLADGSGYFASLTTRSDFGCVLFEPRGGDGGTVNKENE